jgi:uncharacterized protein YuzE
MMCLQKTRVDTRDAQHWGEDIAFEIEAKGVCGLDASDASP